MVADADVQPEIAAVNQGRRRRLKIIVAIGLTLAVGFVVATIYAEHRVNDENERVQQVARSIIITDEDILNYAYGHSDKVSADFGVASDRVAISVDAGETCITVLSEYITSSRTSAFVVRNGSLSPTGSC